MKKEELKWIKRTALILDENNLSRIHISLKNTDLDAKGRAFEQFLGKLFRGGLPENLGGPPPVCMSGSRNTVPEVFSVPVPSLCPVPASLTIKFDLS